MRPYSSLQVAEVKGLSKLNTSQNLYNPARSFNLTRLDQIPNSRLHYPSSFHVLVYACFLKRTAAKEPHKMFDFSIPVFERGTAKMNCE